MSVGGFGSPITLILKVLPTKKPLPCKRKAKDDSPKRWGLRVIDKYPFEIDAVKLSPSSVPKSLLDLG